MYLVADVNQIKKDRATVEGKWEKLLNEAKKLKPGFVDPVIPYKDDHIVGHHNGLDNGNAVMIE